MAQQEINSVSNLLERLKERRQESDKIFWYRGQADAKWKLLPGFFRLKNRPPESDLLNRFRQSATMLTNKRPEDGFDWLIDMQHYGVPTRLLDWTENPLVALYFALNCSAEDKGKDASFWVLEPTELNKQANITMKNYDKFIPSFHDDECQPYSIDYMSKNLTKELNPIAVLATRNNSRIQAQSGVFTIHHVKETPIEDGNGGNHIFKYVVPASSRNTLLNELEVLGLNKFQLFPELATIGELIKESC